MGNGKGREAGREEYGPDWTGLGGSTVYFCALLMMILRRVRDEMISRAACKHASIMMLMSWTLARRDRDVPLRRGAEREGRMEWIEAYPSTSPFSSSSAAFFPPPSPSPSSVTIFPVNTPCVDKK